MGRAGGATNDASIGRGTAIGGAAGAATYAGVSGWVATDAVLAGCMKSVSIAHP